MTPIMILVVVLAVLQSTDAATYKVGDDSGWIAGSSSMYSDWASKHTFLVDDVLEFDFATGVHNVMQVTKTNYESCSGSSPISSWTDGPATVTLDSATTLYFICSIGSHCSRGQKLTVVVSSSSSSTPTATSPPPPPSSTTTSPPPPPSSASSLAAAAAAATSVILGLLYVVAFF